jgi:hypothetical protein
MGLGTITAYHSPVERWLKYAAFFSCSFAIFLALESRSDTGHEKSLEGSSLRSDCLDGNCLRQSPGGGNYGTSVCTFDRSGWPEDEIEPLKQNSRPPKNRFGSSRKNAEPPVENSHGTSEQISTEPVAPPSVVENHSPVEEVTKAPEQVHPEQFHNDISPSASTPAEKTQTHSVASTGSETPKSTTSESDHSGALAFAKKYAIDKINEYRAREHKGLKLLGPDATLNVFSDTAAKEFSDLKDNGKGGKAHIAHGYFQERFSGSWPKEFCNAAAAENQGFWSGSFRTQDDIKRIIDAMLKAMYDEGPGGGHHDTMINPNYTNVGIGLHIVGSQLWMSNDFRGPCRASLST